MRHYLAELGVAEEVFSKEGNKLYYRMSDRIAAEAEETKRQDIPTLPNNSCRMLHIILYLFFSISINHSNCYYYCTLIVLDTTVEAQRIP